MKITQYTTTPDVSLKPFTLQYAGTKMNGAKVLEISENKKYGNFLGFGVAITQSSCYMLNKMDKNVRENFIKDIYTNKGMDLSVARISVASSDYSPYLYSYDDYENDLELKHFSVERDKEFVIPMIKEIISQKNNLYIYSSPWTPPAWMKTGNSLCGGYMRKNYLEVYADYYVKFIKAYKENGIEIKALTSQNETETDQGGRMPACIWHPELESEFVLLLNEKLKNSGLNTEIWLYDHHFQNIPRVIWCLKEYPELVNTLGGIALHYYEGNVEKLDEITEEYPDIKFHFTEGGPRLYDNYENDWCKWGTMINQALNHGCLSFTGWNLLLDETGGPNIGPFFCGGLATYNASTKELTYSGQYKALNHYSRFIKPGAKVYDAKIKYDGLNMFGYNQKSLEGLLSVSAVKNTDGSAVISIVNPNNSKRQIQFNYADKWWYVECLPNSLNTVVIEN